jgi:hypothetical protein
LGRLVPVWVGVRGTCVFYIRICYVDVECACEIGVRGSQLLCFRCPCLRGLSFAGCVCLPLIEVCLGSAGIVFAKKETGSQYVKCLCVFQRTHHPENIERETQSMVKQTCSERKRGCISEAYHLPVRHSDRFLPDYAKLHSIRAAVPHRRFLWV